MSGNMNEKLLKQQLFSHLSRQGFHENIKKQLRVKLIQQLKQRNVIQNKSTNNQHNQLFQRALSSLIIQHLQLTQSSFTESIYSIESGFEGAYITRNQLIQLLTLKQSQISSQQSILQFILYQQQPFSSTTKLNIQIQTIQSSMIEQQSTSYKTIQQKLMMVDQQYRKNMLKKELHNKNNVFNRQQFQHQLQQKYHKQLSLFKQFEIHKIKIQLSQQWRLTFEQYANSISDQYQRKFDQLRKKDKQLNQQYIFRNNQLNLKVNQSQKLINQKLQMLDIKSITVQTQMQNLQKMKRDYEQQIRKKNDQVKTKMLQYDKLCLNIKQKINYEVNLTKLSIQQQYQEKQAETLRRKKIIDEQYGKLMGIKDSINIVQKQNARLSEQNNNLRNRLTTVQSQLKTTVVQLGNKIQRIDILKDNYMEMVEKNRVLQQKTKQEVKKNKRYESEIISIRQQLDKFRIKKQNDNNKINDISLMSEQSSSSVDIDKNIESKKLQQVNKRMEKLKNQRKKDIEKFKLQL